MCACESIRKDIIMVDGVNKTTSSQNSIYNLSLSDLGTLNLDDKTEKAIRKFFKKQGLNEGDTLDLSTYDKDNNGIIDNDERKEAGLKKSVVNAFNKVFQRKTEQLLKNIGDVRALLTNNSKLTATKFEDGATKYEDQDGRRAGYVNADGNLVVINNPDEHTAVFYIDTDYDGIVDERIKK